MSQTLYSHDPDAVEKLIEKVFQKIIKKENSISFINSNQIEDKISQKEASALLGVSITTIIKWKKDKKIPFYKIGKKNFFSKNELLQIARQNKEIFQNNFKNKINENK